MTPHPASRRTDTGARGPGSASGLVVDGLIRGVVVRQAATARTELISADRIAGHLRVVQASFARVLTDFVKDRNPDVANVRLGAEVAGSALAAALVVAVENWGRNGCAGDLGELVAASLDLVRSGLAPLA